ncbi:MAG TPA: hypothetical protein VGW10_09945 [Solirubrobacteraceae bacterium]|nr:hypothetical protein [Solirubrobacteraceae bacterium]
MTFVRNLLADLVAKRLWPVALVLAGALVAVPVLLAQGVESGEVPNVPIASGGEVAKSVVTPAADAPRRGANPTGRNPFSQRTVAPKVKETETSSGTGGTSADAGVGSGVDVSGGLPALEDVDVIPVGGSDGGAPVVPKPDARESYRVDLRFGQDGNLAARNDVARLSPLPSAADPFFVFMGVLADGKTALFLVSSDAEATGDGTCKPTPDNCERIELEAGETEFFDVTTPDGAVVQYQLDLVRVSRVKSASPAVAAGARSRESSEGRQVLRHAIDTKQVDVDGIAYSRSLGVLVPSAAPGEGDGDTLFGGFRTDLRFGPPGELVNRYNLARLTPLPSTESPSFLFLGVIGDAADPTAMFLNPSEAAVMGDAVCNPTPEDCTRVELKPGQSGLFDVPTIDGQSDEYELAVDAITELEAATPEEARAMRDRESPAGRVILRRLITEVGSLVADLNYSSEQGKIVPAK